MSTSAFRPTSCWIALALAASLAGAAESNPRRTPVVEAVERAAPAVVNIATERLVQTRRPFASSFDDLFGWLAQPSTMRTNSLGSGVIIDPDGFVLTNEHVVRRADQIQVQVPSVATPFAARLMAADPDSDLALLKIDSDTPLAWLPLGTSGDLMIGETTIAIGNPFGLASTVSVGVISAINRDFEVNGRVVYHDFLQTDASINPGNSGGPLLNVLGEVIGINTAIRADAQGIGFAIPIDRVRDTIGVLSSPELLTGAYLGLEIDEQGTGAGTQLTVTKVAADGPAARAGIKPGDRIHGVGAARAQTFIQLHKHLLTYRPGDVVTLAVESDAQTEQNLRLTVAERPLTTVERYLKSRLGLRLRALDQRERALGLTAGLVVVEVVQGSNADAVGVRVGDVLLGLDLGRHVYSVDTDANLAALVERIAREETIGIIILRNGQQLAGPLVLN